MKALNDIFYKLKKVIKIILCIFISFAAALTYAVAASEISNDAKNLILTNDNIQALLSIMLWISFFVIIYNKKEIEYIPISIMTGVISLFFGMLIIMPIWIALMYSMLLSVIELQPGHKVSTWTIIRILLIAICVTIYNFTALPEISIVYYIIFSVIFLFAVGIYAEKAVKTKPANADATNDGIAADFLKNTDNNYTSYLTDLKYFSKKLPSPLRTKINEIVILTEKIIRSIEEDKRDEIKGKNFLNRYLPYLNNIIKSYLKIPKQYPEDEVIDQDILASLNALESAFNKQYSNLIENDVQDLTVELSVLDALLKMDGYKE